MIELYTSAVHIFSNVERVLYQRIVIMRWLAFCLNHGVWYSRQEGITFSEEEENKAVEILDTSGDGLIQFEEFVSWWTTKVRQ